MEDPAADGAAIDARPDPTEASAKNVSSDVSPAGPLKRGDQMEQNRRTSDQARRSQSVPGRCRRHPGLRGRGGLDPCRDVNRLVLAPAKTALDAVGSAGLAIAAKQGTRDNSGVGIRSPRRCRQKPSQPRVAGRWSGGDQHSTAAIGEPRRAVNLADRAPHANESVHVPPCPRGWLGEPGEISPRRHHMRTVDLIEAEVPRPTFERTPPASPAKPRNTDAIRHVVGEVPGVEVRTRGLARHHFARAEPKDCRSSFAGRIAPGDRVPTSHRSLLIHPADTHQPTRRDDRRSPGRLEDPRQLRCIANRTRIVAQKPVFHGMGRDLLEIVPRHADIAQPARDPERLEKQIH